MVLHGAAAVRRIPKLKGSKFPGVVEAEQTENGGLTIRLFKRKYLLGDKGEIVKTKGEPMDVPVNSWIDVRLDMPADSVFRRGQYSLQSNGEG